MNMDRREFLKIGAAAAATMQLRALGEGDEDKGWNAQWIWYPGQLARTGMRAVFILRFSAARTWATRQIFGSHTRKPGSESAGGLLKTLRCGGQPALLLASLGIYGTISFLVNEQSREIAIRLALGAQRGAILKMVLCQ